jgi:hypothetical protein
LTVLTGFLLFCPAIFIKKKRDEKYFPAPLQPEFAAPERAAFASRGAGIYCQK